MIAPIKYERIEKNKLTHFEINKFFNEIIMLGGKIIHYQEKPLKHGVLGEQKYNIVVIIGKFQENIL